jgi:gas vesicle protein GvpA/GvpJ/GvpM family
VKRRAARRSTVARTRPPKVARPAGPPPSGPRRPPPPRSRVARLIDESDASLLDVIDNLLNRGVVLNADLILALANVDLVYVRLSALLCAADRLVPRDER